MNIFSIGVSGLNAASIGLATASHNIANASTPGYNRQIILQGTNLANYTGAGFIGQGTHVQTVQRVYSQFLGQQVMSAQSSASSMDSYLAQVSQIDNLLGDANVGLSSALAGFFAGVQQVAATPTSIAARQSMLSSASALVSRFQALDDRMAEVRSGVNSQITSEVSAINTYSKEIADLNQRIAVARAGSMGTEPNDLLDQRDYAIAELNKHIRVASAEQGDGTFSVYLSNGQPLVVGDKTFDLKAVPSAADPKDTVVAAVMADGSTTSELPDKLLDGGSLGGLVAFRSDSLNPAQNSLGRIAAAIVRDVNDQHRLGQDLNGLLGGDFFSLDATLAPTVVANSGNADTTPPTTATVTATFIATTATRSLSSELAASDYRLSYDGANYTLTRLSDNTSWMAASPAAVATAAQQGFDLNIGAGTIADGASFLIQPTRGVVRGMSVAITDPRSIAAAAPFRTAAGTANTGTGSISAGSVNMPPPPNANLQQTVTITVIDATHISISGVGIPAAESAPPYVAYTLGSDLSRNGWTIRIDGTPAVGDTFTVSTNTGGISDNRNAVALAALQTASTMIGGTSSYQEAYAQLVSEVGSKTAAVESLAKSYQAATDQAESARQSMSGVNLDEEAANLIKYQQAYQASAKSIDIASKLFDQLLALGG